MSNIAKIQRAMEESQLPALLLTAEADRRYASGFNAEGAVLILPRRAWLITDSRYIEAASEAVKDAEVLMSSSRDPEPEILRRLLRENGVSSVGVQEESLSFAAYNRLQKKLEAEFLPAQRLTLALRQIKEPWEVENITAAQRIAERALETVLGMFKEGITERQATAELEYQMAKNGSEGLAFDTICIFGENTSRPHGVPTDRKLKNGDFITMDFGCKINGYCSDMTRTVAFGSASDEMRAVYDLVLRAQLAAIDAAKAGIPGKEMDAAARDIIDGAGCGQYFGHGLGHSVGLYIHEGPNASPKEERILPAGAVITCEPGVYLPGHFGVRIEDMLLLTEDGNENLTRAPKELTVL